MRNTAEEMAGPYRQASRPVPPNTMTLSLPYFAWISWVFSTMVSMASSHVMRSHLSSPRSSKARFMGYTMRFGLYTYSGRVRHRTHRRPCVMGWFSSPFTSTSLPSTTCSLTPQPTGWQPGADQAHDRTQ